MLTSVPAIRVGRRSGDSVERYLYEVTYWEYEQALELPYGFTIGAVGDEQPLVENLGEPS
jgi:hypothetical protein